MISEPELVGGTEFPAALEPLPAEPKRSGPRRPWLWALGGAVAASAVWTGGLVAYDRQEDGRGPDLKGYRAEEDPCGKARLPGLSSSFGRKSESTNPLVLDHPNLFRAECVVTLAAEPVPYQLAVTYTLHRVTDPRPEFEARMNDPFQGIGDRVSGAGQVAYLKDDNDGGQLELHVLDGQAVIEFSLSPVITYQEGVAEQKVPPRLDPAATRTFLLEDMNALTGALRAKE
ncbi:hypothetical protein [Streptomyces sp. NPDC093111]|uniref:hypothetical protein n=1 Tax=Streptomyces sp. NPDC093111 TaxID=3154978 RepID=UPI003434C959